MQTEKNLSNEIQKSFIEDKLSIDHFYIRLVRFSFSIFLPKTYSDKINPYKSRRNLFIKLIKLKYFEDEFLDRAFLLLLIQ